MLIKKTTNLEYYNTFIMQQRKKINILSLPGIKDDDFKSIDDLFEFHLQQKMEPQMIEEIPRPVFDEIPNRFYDKKSWIKSTNLKCGFCTRNYKTMPFFIPRTIKCDEDDNEYFEVLKSAGLFCSINCAYSRSSQIYTDQQFIDCSSRLMCIYFIIFNVRIFRIPFSPPMSSLAEFGGEYTHDDYEEKINELNSDNTLSKFKLSHFQIPVSK